MIKVVTREREGAEKAPTRSYSKKQESKVAKDIGGKRVINSGATAFAKGDVTLENLMLIECKTASTASCISQARLAPASRAKMPNSGKSSTA